MKFELCIRVGRKVIFRHVCTLEQCKELIEYWTNLSTGRKYEHTYTLRPIDSDTLQD